LKISIESASICASGFRLGNQSERICYQPHGPSGRSACIADGRNVFSDTGFDILECVVRFN